MPQPAQGSHRLWSPPIGAAPPSTRVTLERPAARQHGASDAPLLDQIERLARTPRGWSALVLRLSRLPPPGAQAHHHRIARALLQDHARLHEGQVAALHGGDLVLLAPPHGDPAALTRLLLRLLRAPDPIARLWRLDDEAEQLAADLTAPLAAPLASRPDAQPPAPESAPPAGEPGATDALDALAASLPVAAALHRQTAVLLGSRMRPLFREISISIAALEARLGLRDAAADPYLFRHLATRLDHRLLVALTRAAGTGTPLDVAPDDPAIPRAHLNLTLSGILSPEFDRFAQACGPLRPAIEVAFVDACADPAGYAQARARLARADMALVLDGISYPALLLTHPGRLAPGLVKLDWSAQLPQLRPADRAAIDAAIAAIGPDRLVLQRAGSEAALHWGMARGIRRFQGRHVDAMQAAARITACPAAAQCALRQCLERASAAGQAGRHGCANQPLLDAALPMHLVT